MPFYYTYTLRKHASNIHQQGMFSGGYNYTTTEYFNSSIAGQALGVRPSNIDCALKFRDDGLFTSGGDVDAAGRFTGGGNQYSHANRPKPIAIRDIGSRIWEEL